MISTHFLAQGYDLGAQRINRLLPGDFGFLAIGVAVNEKRRQRRRHIAEDGEGIKREQEALYSPLGALRSVLRTNHERNQRPVA